MKRFIKKTVFFILLASVLPVYSLEVNKSELETTTTQEIQFNSYTGPVTVFNTMAQIRNIGTELGKKIADGENQAGSSDRYQVIHCVSEDSDEETLDADIFILGKNVGVDHIRNLRAIISAYLVAAYDYSVQDADTLSTYITVYNAVYRSKFESISSKYKSNVVQNVQSPISGLSTEYTEWPGKTQIIIPLTGRGRGSLSAIDTTTISDKEVVNNIKESSDKGIDIRSEMADLKEREADEASLKAQDAAKDAADAQLAVKDAQLETKEAINNLREAEKAEQEAQEAYEDALNKSKTNPDDTVAQQKALDAALIAEESKKDSAKAAEDAKKAQEKLNNAKVEANEKTALAAEEQGFADKKRQEAQNEEKDIAKDIASLSPEGDLENAAYGLKLVDKNNLFSAIVLLDSKTGKELKTSSMKFIRGRSLYKDGSNFVAIAGKEGGNAAIRLVLIDGISLEISLQSEEIIYDNAVLAESNGFYFTVIQDGADWLIGKYNSEMKLLSKSSTKVEPTTPILISGNTVCINDSIGNCRLLNIDSLEIVK